MSCGASHVVFSRPWSSDVFSSHVFGLLASCLLTSVVFSPPWSSHVLSSAHVDVLLTSSDAMTCAVPGRTRRICGVACASTGEGGVRCAVFSGFVVFYLFLSHLCCMICHPWMFCIYRCSDVWSAVTCAYVLCWFRFLSGSR